MAAKQERKRRRYWIDPKLQGRFLGNFLFVVLIVMSLSTIVPMLSASGVLDSSTTEGPSWPLLISVFAIASVAIASCIAYMSIRLSHRICGPVYRIQTSLEALRRGERPAPIDLRDNDELIDLAKEVDETIEFIFQHGFSAPSTADTQPLDGSREAEITEVPRSAAS